MFASLLVAAAAAAAAPAPAVLDFRLRAGGGGGGCAAVSQPSPWSGDSSAAEASWCAGYDAQARLLPVLLLLLMVDALQVAVR